VTFLASFFSPSSDGFALAVLACAFGSSFLGMLLIDALQKRFKVKDDAALCFVLSVFFGFGVLIASRIQTTHALWYKQIQAFLYGQAATMRDIHIVIYATLFLITTAIIVFLYREIQILTFDKSFGQSIGINARFVEMVLLLLTVLAIVIGIRSVGVVMMAGMLIAPALAARLLTNRLKTTFFIAGIIGGISGFSGNYFSVMIPYYLHAEKLSLPTGPMILLSAVFICLLALFFAPQKGLFTRMVRVLKFKRNCQLENILKALWKEESNKGVSLAEVAYSQNLPRFKAWLRMRKLLAKKWLMRSGKRYLLSETGEKKAKEVVRLHRLWELYLVHLGHSKDKVHASAEEMEHVLTPELEKQLTELLDNPGRDPHDQPIPKKERLT
jgi:manganese/zinc/iron transport system permease protein